MVDIEKIDSELDQKPGSDKNDQATRSHAGKENRAKLIDDEVTYLRRRERVLLITTLISGAFTLILFFGVLCTLCKFYDIYESHAHVSQAIESPLPLAPFILLLSPAALFSTLFVVTLITTLRFITAYANANTADKGSDSIATAVVDTLASCFERFAKG